MSEMTPEEALAVLGIDIDLAIADNKKIQETGPRDNRICVCGHGVNKHDPAGLIQCKPNALVCKCKVARPVLETTDTRLFLRKTEGFGSKHALSRGITGLYLTNAKKNTNKSITWLIPLACDRCKKDSPKLIPTPLTLHAKTVATIDTGLNALLCEDCVAQI